MLVGLSEVCHSIHSGLLEPVPLDLSYNQPSLTLPSSFSVPHISCSWRSRELAAAPRPHLMLCLLCIQASETFLLR